MEFVLVGIVAVGVVYLGNMLYRVNEFEKALKAQIHVPNGKWVDVDASWANYTISRFYDYNFKAMIVERKV